MRRHPFLKNLIVLILLGGALGACATPQSGLLLGDQTLARSADITTVPFFPQEDHYCGPASLAMVLNWSGERVSQQDLAKQVFTPEREGTFRTDMITAARRHGRLAVEVTTLNDLMRELSAGNPVIVFQNLGLGIAPRWHFAVATGYDLEERTLTLHSGTRENHVTGIKRFERTWKRGDYWGLAVMRAGKLPASSTVWQVLRGAVGLERADRVTEASDVYRSVIRRWPERLSGHMGLGNALFDQDRYADAEKAYRGALVFHPDAADAWNNLAYALDAQGKTSDAIFAAQKAVMEAEHKTPYRETLAELTRE